MRVIYYVEVGHAADQLTETASGTNVGTSSIVPTCETSNKYDFCFKGVGQHERVGSHLVVKKAKISDAYPKAPIRIDDANKPKRTSRRSYL